MRSEIIETRDESKDLSQADVSLSESNLFQFYKMNSCELLDDQRKLNLEAHTKFIFQFPIETVLT